MRFRVKKRCSTFSNENLSIVPALPLHMCSPPHQKSGVDEVLVFESEPKRVNHFVPEKVNVITSVVKQFK